MFARGPIDDDQTIFVQFAQGVEVQVSTEKRAAGFAAGSIDDQGRTSDPGTIGVGQGVGGQEDVFRQPSGFSQGPLFGQVVGRKLGLHFFGSFEVGNPALLPADHLEKILGIGEDSLGHGGA